MEFRSLSLFQAQCDVLAPQAIRITGHPHIHGQGWSCVGLDIPSRHVDRTTDFKATAKLDLRSNKGPAGPAGIGTLINEPLHL